MAEACNTQSKDWLSRRASILLAWGIPLAIIVATAVPQMGGTWRTVGWAGSLAWAGGACVLNASRCGRVHCYVTGPFYLLLALASLLHGTGVVSLGAFGWQWIGLLLLVGGGLLTWLPERMCGAYRKRS